MKKFIVILLVICTISGTAQTTFNRYYSNQTSSEGCVMMDGILTPDGGSIGVGYLATMTSMKALILKLDAAGDTLWVRFDNDLNTTYYSSVDVDGNGDIVVAGFNNYDPTLSKYNNLGVLQWAQSLDVSGNDNEQIERADNYTIRERPQVAVDGTDLILATSSRNFNGSGSPDSLHFHIAKFTTTGSLTWSNRINFQTGITGDYYDIDESFLSGVIVHSTGKVIISGMHTSWAGSADFKRTFVASFDASGNYIANSTIQGSGSYQGIGFMGLTELPSGNVLAYGRSFNMVGTSNNGMALVEYDDNLNLLETNIYNTSGRCRHVEFDGSGNLLTLVEDADISSDGFNRTAIVKLDPSYNVLWAWDYGSYQNDKAPYLGKYTNGDLGIISSTNGFGGGMEKVYAVRTDLNGVTVGCNNVALSFTQESPVVGTTSLSAIETSAGAVSAVGGIDQGIALTYNLADISYSDSITNPLCNGDQGSVELTMISTSSPFTFQWSNGTTSSSIIDNAGSYDVLIRDTYGCMKRDTFNVVDPAILDASATSTGVSCYGFGDATIDLTVSGGTAGYSFDWTTGQSSEDLSGISGGFFQVTVTDTNGCVDIVGVSVSEPMPLSAVIASSELTTCFGDCDGQLNSLITGGTSPYVVSWNDPLAQANDTAVGLCAGQYLLTVNDVNGCIAYANGDVYEPSLLVGSLSAVTTECGTSSGSAWVDAIGGTMPYAYTWTGGGVTDTITGLDQETYVVIVTDLNGCVYEDSIDVEAIVNTQEICVVTVDSNNLNQVNWTKPVVGNVEGYNVYRNIAGTYVQIGYTDYDSLSFFTDNSFGVDPSITSYRYKLSVVDTCGNESDLGGYHETIHLTANVGTGGEVNLIWDNYEGFSFGYYRILRDSTGTNTWQVLDSVPFTNFTFTDPNVPTIGADYLIEVVTPSFCDATKAIGDFNSSRSNRKSGVAGPNWINETEVIRDVYPNPFSDQIKVEITRDIIESIQLFDIQGRIVVSEAGINNSSYVVDANSVVTGTYILQVKTKYGQFNEVVTKSW